MPKLSDVFPNMGLILAMPDVVCPDPESHINVISITKRGCHRNGALKLDSPGQILFVKQNLAPRAGGLEF